MRKMHFKGHLQRKYNLLSNERALNMLKNGMCFTGIGQAILEIFHFRVDIPRTSWRIRISLNVSIKRSEQ